MTPTESFNFKVNILFNFFTFFIPQVRSICGVCSFCLFCNYVCLFVCLFVCLSVNFFSVKDFSATTWARILKFGTKLDSDELYCVTNNSYILLISPFITLQWKFLSKISQLLLEPVF